MKAVKGTRGSQRDGTGPLFPVRSASALQMELATELVAHFSLPFLLCTSRHHAASCTAITAAEWDQRCRRCCGRFWLGRRQSRSAVPLDSACDDGS